MTTLRFRYATAADVPTLASHVHDAYRGEVSRAGWTTEADLLDGQRTDVDELMATVAAPDSRMLLGECEGELVASLRLSTQGDAAYIGMVAVRPLCQARGIGRGLLIEAERIARTELGARRVRMTVIAQRDELIAWYERRGYARTGEQEPFPYGEPRFGLPKRPDLYFVVLEKALG